MVKIIIVVALMIAGLVTLGVVENNMNAEQTQMTTLIEDNNQTTLSENEISVTLSGEIKNPGTYIMEEGSRLEDVITAAGGVTDNADEKAYSLDYILENKMSFYIAPIYDNAQVCSTTPISKFNVNSASVEELKTINGVKENAATNIVSYRINNPYKRLEDLLLVDYVGNATFEKMKNYITLR